MSPVVITTTSTSVATLQIGRLLLGAPPSSVTEPVGDPVGSLGGAVVPAARTGQQFQVALATYLSGQGDSLLTAQKLRRQLRSLLNNSPMKLQGYLYVVYSDDPEQNGWYVPDATTLSGFDKASWKAIGLWQTGSGNWFLAGRRRTHREARSVWMKDLRTGSYARDQLGWIYSTDFSALPALQLSVLPNGALQAANTVSGAAYSGPPLPAGRDGGVCQVLQGLADLTVVSYERAEAALNLSDVIVYDRFGAGDAPSTGPGATWQECYGPDWPWNWLTAGQPADSPVLDNGLVRMRYDATSTPGFRVDVWTGAAYVEQGKMVVERIGDSTGYCNTWVSAILVEWTPDRAVLLCVLANSGDANSRERVYITVERGALGATFECYPALKAAGGQADVVLQWTPALNSGAADLNQGVAKIDSQGSGSWTPGAAGTAVYAATAGTGAGTGNSGQFGAIATLGAANFASSENWAAILRCPTAYNVIGAYQTTLVVLQAANAIVKYGGSSSTAYGSNQDTYQVSSQTAAGYAQCQVAFSATQADQILEAEGMTLGTGTSSTADAAASGGNAATATRTTDANAHVTRATWPNGFQATYRVFARVKVSANTGSFYAKTGATTGATVTTTSASYVWLDLGEITANNTTLEIHAWIAAGGTLSVDRVEAVLVQDRARTAAIYSGARDAAQSALEDSRMLGALVAR